MIHQDDPFKPNMMDDDLEALRRKRLTQLQGQVDAQSQQQAQMAAQAQQQAQAEAMKENLLRRILSNEAKERLARIRMAHPEQAQHLESQLLSLVQSGQLRSMVDEATLIQIMRRLKPPQREINITRR